MTPRTPRRSSVRPLRAPSPRRTRRYRRAVLLAGVLLAVFAASLPSARPAAAQALLPYYTDSTTVRKLSFKFASTQTFDDAELEEQMVTADPTFFDRVQDVLPFTEPLPHFFAPVDLQKDVVRLRRFYVRNGFLHPLIDYGASQLDTSRNAIHVILSIEEGPPLIIQDVGFFGPDGRYAFYQFPEDRRDGWIGLRDDITVERGERYTEFDRLRIQDAAVAWLQNRGYAFARVEGEALVDSALNAVDLRFVVDPGPIATIDEIDVDGNELVDAGVIRREVPFNVGERFSSRALVRGQRELFGLNLFRVALVNVAEGQPRDSTVSVEIRVREAQPRYITAQTGYAREDGVRLAGEWTHRNFVGGARNLSLSAAWNTGFLNRAREDAVNRRFRTGVNLKQPFLFVTQLTAFVEPFYLWERNELREGQQVGVNTTLFYELLPFRYLSLRHTFTHVLSAGQSAYDPLPDEDDLSSDFFNLSQFTLSGTVGNADDYVQPSRGYLLRPFAETASRFLGSNLTYHKLGLDASGYRPLTERISLNGRIFAGRLFLLGGSRYDEDAAFNEFGRIVGPTPEAVRDIGLLENRFDPIRFYAGGSSDVRGWYERDLGPVVVAATTGGSEPDLLAPDEVVVRRDSAGAVQDVVYFVDNPDEEGPDSVAVPVDFDEQALGGLGKLTGSVELRLPFPGLGPNWSTAAFLDFGQVSEGSFNPADFRFGVGGGLRYQTLVGFIRLDIGYKLNPSAVDLNTAEDIWLVRNGFIDELDDSLWRRFALHLSIGQAF